MVKALIVGAGRCGTLYLCQSLLALGFVTHHEALFLSERGAFQPNRRADTYPEWNQYEVISANGAAAWYGLFPTETIIIHLVRNPLDMIRSWLSLETYSRPLDPIAVEWRARYAPYIFLEEDELGKCIQHVVGWDMLCAAASEYGYPYFPIRLEDLDAPLMGIICEMLGVPDIPERLIQVVLNSRKGDSMNQYELRREREQLPPKPKIPREQVAYMIQNHKLRREVDQMCLYYGYDPV